MFPDPHSRLIGQGGNGKVYLYFNKNNQKLTPVAVKQIVFESKSDDKNYSFNAIIDKLVSELYLAPKLHSQYLVTVHQTFFDTYRDGTLTASLIMEYCPDGSLSSLKTEVNIFLFIISYLILERSWHSACLSVKSTKILKGP